MQIFHVGSSFHKLETGSLFYGACQTLFSLLNVVLRDSRNHACVARCGLNGFSLGSKFVVCLFLNSV